MLNQGKIDEFSKGGKSDGVWFKKKVFIVFIVNFI